jgi:hypothetical protein
VGILEELGLTEDDLEPHNQPPSVLGDPVPLEGIEEKPANPSPEEGSLLDIIMPEADPFFQDLRNSPVESDPLDRFLEDAMKAPVTPESGLPSAEEEAPDTDKAKRKSKRVVYSVACTLHLSGSDYQVQPLPESSEYDKGYRLNKINAKKPTGYNVLQVDGEILCECYDFVYRQDGASSKGCKHIRGLVDMGFFAAPPVRDRKSYTFGG